MPRFPCQWSVKAENGCNRPSVQSAKDPIALGPVTRSLDLDEAPEGSPPAAAFLERQPGISGRFGEADSAQPTRNCPCHTRLGFGLDSGLISPRWCACAMRYARFGLGCTLPKGAAHTLEACNLTRTARVQCKDCIQPCDSELSNCSVRDSPLRPALAAILDAAAIGTLS